MPALDAPPPVHTRPPSDDSVGLAQSVMRALHSTDVASWCASRRPAPTSWTVQVSVPAYPDQPFGGTVVTVADKPDALLVPRAAVAANVAPNTQSNVVTTDPTGHVVHTPVRIGLATDDQVEIASDLAEGQVVLTGNTGGLTDGQIVQPQIQAPLTALAR